MAEMAFAVRRDLIVVVHNECAPGQTRWEEFCRECRRIYVHLSSALESRSMLVVSDGGGPNVLQRAQLLNAVERVPIRTSVVSSSSGVWHIHAALQLFNAHARCFDVEQLGQAMSHIRRSPRQFRQAASLLDELCQLVPRALTAQRVAEELETQYCRQQRKVESGVQGTGPIVPQRRSFFQRLRRGA